MPQFIKTKTFRIAAIAALLIGLYALAGFVLAPRLVRNALMTEIPKTLAGVTPSVGDIRINPFLLQVQVKDFSLTGSGGTKLVGFARLFVDFVVSTEGQEIFRNAGYLPSRPDVPPLSPAISPQLAGFKANLLAPEMIDRNISHWSDVFAAIFR